MNGFALAGLKPENRPRSEQNQQTEQAMARRRKGRNITGWLLIDKPAGWTSTAVVNKVRWAFGAQKAGHAGTLDPAATGLLVIAFGEATKALPYITDDLKAYHFTVNFGAATNTDDAEGEVIETSTTRPTRDQIEALLPSFVGDIEQVPPAFSAVKIDGERAYAKARDGEDVTLAARPLYVESLTLLDMPDNNTATLELICGKGGYVRAIARDMGRAMGCLGHVQSLRRTWSGPFDVEDCAPFDVIEASSAANTALDHYIQPLETGLERLPRVTVKPEAAIKLRHGNAGEAATSECDYGDLCWASSDAKAVAIGTYRAGMIVPTRVFLASQP
jgi:tRNA pseudouridine55 synthase